MRIPKSSSGAYRVLKALYGNGVMELNDLAVAAHTSVGNTAMTASEHGLTTGRPGFYCLTPEYVRYFDMCATAPKSKLQVALPRSIDIWAKPLNGAVYAANLSRYMRQA